MRNSAGRGGEVREVGGGSSRPIRRFRVQRRVRVAERVINTNKAKIQNVYTIYYLNAGNRESVQELISSIPSHVVFIFVIPLLVGLLQLDYQSKRASPFQTHPINMWAFFIALGIYCMGLLAKKKIQTHWPNYSQISKHVTLVSGALSSVSLASIFLQHLLGKLIFFVWALLLVMVARRVVLHVCQLVYKGTMKVVLQVVNILRRIMECNLQRLSPLPK